ncbi:DUF4352 domain-containing protein [Aerococcus christensenii]|uniref:DUF4352 domain-containing protein n=1 Tax=Aerococcus christensenii TaxID=87541 RepID=A0A133XSP0_9LACT|nr:DUF4352 domain-containing protein [Aerococcus christensenii]KXB33947.1 hypothetical protein HMPREF3187_01591 [Aerococcus christensenii]MDK8234715.1 DUF4352 domain-containing protein [Aerococcus christensenii]DAK63201.1 MAG TPA: protein of unknown function (DUF4352) [Caudoviricetes sp.]
MRKKLYDENGNEVKRGGCLKNIGIGIIAIIVIFIIAGIFGKKSNDKPTASNNEKTEQTKKNEKLKVGDSATVSDITFTVNKVEFTDKRNQYAKTKPERVIKISYTIKNGQKKDYPYGIDMQVYVDGKKSKTYPLMGSSGEDVGFGSVSAGRTVDTVAYYEVNGKNIELEWAPAFSQSKKKIWVLGE